MKNAREDKGEKEKKNMVGREESERKRKERKRKK